MSDQWRILIVEDDEEVSQNIVTSLRKDGYQVQGVVGSAAIRVLWSEDYDVVISDLRTPGAEGFDLLEWVRAYRPNLRMIMFGPQEMRSQSLERGAVGFVLAPVDLHELKEELRRLLQQTGFSASLDSFDLLDVIQIITMSRKDIALLINTGLEERGTLGFKTGDLIWADYGVLRGEEAFFALAAHKNGTVIYQPWNAQIRPNVTQPLSRLIFQALQYRSKYALAIPQTGEQPSVKASDASGLSLLDVDDDDSPFLVLQDGEDAPPVQQDGEVDVMLTEKTGQSREWWEGTGRIAAINLNSSDKNTRNLNPKSISARLAPLPSEEEPDLEELPNPTNTRLPSWVTDQPTMAHFPAVNLESAATSAASQSETTWSQENFYKESAPPPPFEAAEDWEPVS
ncbi:MAG TPA: response regulator, partial [Ktedonobacteraceae bacterium]|nr:response regulator [Ktedonobacteraceae bacterium]